MSRHSNGLSWCTEMPSQIGRAAENFISILGFAEHPPLSFAQTVGSEHSDKTTTVHGRMQTSALGTPQKGSLRTLVEAVALKIAARSQAVAHKHATMLVAAALMALCSTFAAAQGGPPYYTNDPGTPGHLNWEINVGYMPFYFQGQSTSHTPDLDINFGVGSRIQLTYENAWLRVKPPGADTRFGLGQSNPGVKWRFYDAGEDHLSISVFPQLFLNNPNDAVRRGITPVSQTFELPVEFSDKVGPVDVDFELGYDFVHKGPNGWIGGLVVGRDITHKLEFDVELYNQGTFHPGFNQPTLDFGGRYKLHSPIIVLAMAGRALRPSSSNQTYFLGYFGLQFLLPPKSYPSDLPEHSEEK